MMIIAFRNTSQGGNYRHYHSVYITSLSFVTETEERTKEREREKKTHSDTSNALNRDDR